MIAVDPAANGNDVYVLLVRDDFSIECCRPRSIARNDTEKPVGVDLVLELVERSVNRPNQPVRSIGMELARIENRASRRDRRDNEGLGEGLLAQNPIEGRVARHGAVDGLGLRFEFDIRSMRDLRRRSRRLLTARRQEHTSEKKDDTSLHRCRAV